MKAVKNNQRGVYKEDSKVAWVQLQSKHFDTVTKIVIAKLLIEKVPLKVLSLEKAKAYVHGPVPGEKRKAADEEEGEGTITGKAVGKAKVAAAMKRLLN